MGKRKGTSSKEPQTLNRVKKVEDDEEEDNNGEKGGFFACYLLTSLCPRFKGHTYIGYTVNPKRRIRQHNGEIGCGAFRTKKKRPWEMVLCIYGFPTNVAALQFEWAWQHPVESLAVRKAAVEFKSLGGIANKIKLAYTMLTLPAWQSLDLTVNFFSTKYTNHSAGCPSLPDQMKMRVCSMDELPCYGGEDWNTYEYNELPNDDNDVCKNFEETTSESNEHIEENLEDSYNHLSDSPYRGFSPFDSSSESVFAHVEDCSIESDKDIRTRKKLPNRQKREKSSLGSDISVILTDEVEVIDESDVDLRTRIELHCEKSSSASDDSSIILPDEVEVIDDSNVDFRTRNQLLCQKSQSTMNRSKFIPNEVEVIDVFTPSPVNKVNSKKKKIDGMISSSFPDIIDLTESPIVV